MQYSYPARAFVWHLPMLLLAGCWLLYVAVPSVVATGSALPATRTTLVRVASPAPAPAPVRAGQAIHAMPAPTGSDSAAGNRRAPIPNDVATGRWMLDAPSEQQELFRAAVASAPPVVRQLTESFDERTRVRVLERTRCGDLNSCAIGIVSEHAGERTSRYALEFVAGAIDESEAARFLILHEIGHLADYEGLTSEDLARFEAAFRASPAWRDCFPHEETCVAMDELFADQFAIYATGRASSLTTYATPRLLNGADFEALLRATYRA